MIEDIEDILEDGEVANTTGQHRVEKQINVNPRNSPHEVGNDPRLPGNQNIHLKVWGCSHNISDKEYMAGILQEQGYAVVDSDENADLVVLVSCTVKEPSEAHFYTYMHRLLDRGIKVIAAGCVPQGESKDPKLEHVSLIGVQQIDRIAEVAEQTLLGHTVRLMSQRKRPELDLPKIRRNKYVEIVPINTGCLNTCTYCKTKHARGKLGSYTVESIVDRIRKVASEGVTEIWLTSEDTGAYGRDIGTNIGELLFAILAVLEQPEYGHMMLKIGMTNPPYMLEHIDAIIKVLNHPRVFSILHIPVQSGSNKILELMKREYTREDFQYIVDQLVSRVPDMTVATDIICGFPYEYEEDFNDTYALVDKNRFSVMHTTQFYARPKTPAAKMPKVNSAIVKQRTKKLDTLFNSYDCYSKYVGTEMRVWITNEVAKDKVHMVGHSKNYTQVLMPLDESMFGQSVVVKIHSHVRFCVTGTIVEGSLMKRHATLPAAPASRKIKNTSSDDDSSGDGTGDNEGNSDKESWFGRYGTYFTAATAVCAVGMTVAFVLLKQRGGKR